MRRTRLLLAVVAAVLVGFVTPGVAATSTDSPIGYWKTIDDITGRPKSIVQISKTREGALMAKIVKVFPSRDSNVQTGLCIACKGEMHNQPIVGMVIMSGLKLGNKQWKNGEILDPENGKTYNCTAHLTENGKRLNVHGYVGLPLFGRSQTWERVDLMSG